VRAPQEQWVASPQGLKPASLLALSGTAEEAAEKVVRDQTVSPQRLKPDSKQSSYRSAEALRHPKSTAKLSFSAACKAAPLQNKVKIRIFPPPAG